MFSTAAKDIHAFAQAHGMPVWCSGMLEAGVGRAHNIAHLRGLGETAFAWLAEQSSPFGVSSREQDSR